MKKKLRIESPGNSRKPIYPQSTRISFAVRIQLFELKLVNCRYQKAAGTILVIAVFVSKNSTASVINTYFRNYYKVVDPEIC